jgi:glycosyltransferase involved in cell wall biosynthesis
MSSPVRILHVLKTLSFGGIEIWLMHLLRHVDRRRIEMDFLLHDKQNGDFEDEARQLGARIFRGAPPNDPFGYARTFRKAVKDQGCDVVHSHLQHYSGYVLKLAHAAKVPVRIAHSHNDTRLPDSRVGPLRKAYYKQMKRWIRQYATIKLAVTNRAALALYGSQFADDPGTHLLNYVVDLNPFRVNPEPMLRSSLGIPSESFVMVHVGILKEQKNHLFLLRVLWEVRQRHSDVRLLLVGDGRLRTPIENAARDLGLHENVVFAGSRSDVASLLSSVGDVFVFPSLWEGFGLVALEAQAAGLPCFLSDVVPQEADVVPELVHRISLEESPARWAETILAARQPQITHEEAFRRIVASPFNIENHLRQLEALYLQGPVTHNSDDGELPCGH